MWVAAAPPAKVKLAKLAAVYVCVWRGGFADMCDLDCYHGYVVAGDPGEGGTQSVLTVNPLVHGVDTLGAIRAIS